MLHYLHKGNYFFVKYLSYIVILISTKLFSKQL